MKRRVIGIITALALCLGLCPAWVLAADTQAPADDGSRKVDLEYSLEEPWTFYKPYSVDLALLFDTCGYSVTAPDSTAISVGTEGTLYLTGGGTVTSQKGAGVEVQAGGSLYIEDTGLTVTGSTYGLDIASSAPVKLSGGTYTGTTAAIRILKPDGAVGTKDDFDKLLKKGYSYFEANGNLIPLENVATAKTVVIKQRIAIKWRTPTKVDIDYDGSPVEITDLPGIEFTSGNEALKSCIQYSYRKSDGTDFTDDLPFTDGLPINAGTYEIKASIPEQPSYSAAEAILPLTINKISAVTGADKDAPKAKTLIYNREPQELVTAGVLKPGAVADGAVIEYKLGASGTYSTDIPVGITASGYDVQYRVTDTENYIGVSGTIIPNPDPNYKSAQINPKPITPTIELSATSYVYDGSVKKPTITVKDGQTVIEDDQYTTTWTRKDNQPYTELRNTGTYIATIENVTNGNYTFSKTVEVEIVKTSQNALSITGQPTVVYYGDKITTLDTTGGTGNGTVTWSVVSGNARFDSSTLNIIGVGSVTVKAERAVDNYNSVEDTWTFTVQPKPVEAVVTIESKKYDEAYTSGAITAVVKDSDKVNNNDEITLTGLTGKFSDPNVGTGKTVTLDSTEATKSDTANKYSITYPATAIGTITPKPVTPTVTLSGNDLQTDSNATPKYYYNFDGTEKRPDVTVRDGSTIIPDSNYTVSYSDNKNVSTTDKVAKVTVTAKAGGNYTFPHQEETFTIKKVPSELITAPKAQSLTFNREAQDLVDVGTANGGKVVYSLEQAGSYSETVPQKEDAGTYTVYYKVKGDSNHEDSTPDPNQVSVTIKRKEITPLITLSQYTYTYDGKEEKPTVTVKDGNTIIDTEEFTVSYRNNTNAGTATVIVSDQDRGNYIVNGTDTFTITKKQASVTEGGVAINNGLTYNGKPQPLVTADPLKVQDGKLAYSLDGVNYSLLIPTGTDAGTYTVWYKVIGSNSDNYKDSEPAWETVTIQPKPITATVTIAPKVYDRTVVIAPSSITASVNPSDLEEGDGPIRISGLTGTYNNENVGTGKPVTLGEINVVVSGKGASNYKISYSDAKGDITAKSVTVTVTVADNGLVYDSKLKTPAVTVTADDGAVLSPGSDYTVSYSDNMNAGTATVTVTAKADGNYAFTDETVNFTIEKGQAEYAPEPEGKTGLVYNTGEQSLVSGGSTKNGIGVIKYSLSQNGEYLPTVPSAKNANTYKVWYKVEGTGNYEGIGEKFIEVKIEPKPVESPEIMLAGEKITKGSDGTYYYDSNNPWTDREVTITVKDGEKLIDSGEYEVTYTPDVEEDPKTITVRITNKENSNYSINASITIKIGTEPQNEGLSGIGTNMSSPASSTPSGSSTQSSSSTPGSASAPMQTSVKNGAATTVMSAAAGDKLVKEATASQSGNVVIKPEITGDVTKAEVSLPASTVSKLKSQTDAALTVSTPVADVTIPNAALDTLSSSGGTVSVVTEQVENAVTLTLTANGKSVESIPGGVTLSVPVEDAAPGTVAVLVREDGTRETIRKSVAENGELSIPLDGSATVEIVDNSKDFADVSDTDWEAGAVAFASAHELFNGTSETTFSPDQPMSLGMLTTVLYNLEGGTPQSGESDDAWYAPGMSWAEENGITSGDSQFGPNDSVTREQLAVMLWKYAGSPAADGQTLSFTDADQASDYAMEALCWATANGILNGYGDGQLDPGGLATRAQAAQMLKNFMENT